MFWKGFDRFASALNPFFSCIFSFGYYFFFYDTGLSVSAAYTVIAVIDLLCEPLAYIPDLLSKFYRIADVLRSRNIFLNLNEVKRNVKEGKRSISNDAIRLENTSFDYCLNSDVFSFSLSDLDISIRKGEIVCVIGEIASGKSSLLKSVLGEMRKVKGNIIMESNKLIYFPQFYWMETGKTIKENILFNQPYDEVKYDEVLRLSSLMKDIQSLKMGDATILGDQFNINLSVGQCARLNLARTLYFSHVDDDDEILLFDDIFSALDERTATTIFRKVFLEHLKGKTCVVITHKRDFLTHANRVIVMKNGRILECAKLSELKCDDKFVKEIGNLRVQKGKGVIRNLRVKTKVNESLCEKKEGKDNLKKKKKKKKKKGQLAFKEYSFFKVLFSFCRRVGYIRMSYLSLLCIGTIFVTDFANVFLNLFLFEENKETKYFIIYVIFETIHLLLFLYMQVIGRNFMIDGSTNYQEELIGKLLFSKLKVFDKITFSTTEEKIKGDLFMIQRKSYRALTRVVLEATKFIMSLTLIIYSSPLSMIMIIPVCIIFWFLDTFYRKSKRGIRKIIKSTKVPLRNLRRNAMIGGEVIRSYQQEEVYFKHHTKLVQNNFNACYTGIRFNRWFSVRRKTLSFIFVIVTLLLKTNKEYLPLFALLISHSSKLTKRFTKCLGSFQILMNFLFSVENMEQFLNKLEVENLTYNEFNEILHGEVEFKNVMMKYSPELSNVLSGASFTWKDSKKIMLVGVTGQGKSTIFQLLLKLRDFQEGNIFIDEKPIREINTSVVRNFVSVIPQKPILFNMSIRENVDPHEKFEDHKIFALLHEFKMAKRIVDLSVHVSEINFSFGELQILCFIRAILRENAKIFIFDEFTSNIDIVNKQMIDEYVEKNLNNKTIIVISHQYDKQLCSQFDDIYEVKMGKVLKVK